MGGKVESKDTHNSSFFQADSVDSVHVIVNKGISSVIFRETPIDY